MNQPTKIFLSYSTESAEHQQWVIALCNQLIGNGIDATMDVYELQLGQDMYAFMERMVSGEFDRIVVISDASYAHRANARKGGVGAETQLLTKEIYNNVQQQRIIPIYTEKDSNNKPVLPFFLESRLALDFSNPANYEQSYAQLYLAITGEALHQKPPIGKKPHLGQVKDNARRKINLGNQKNKNIIEKGISNVGNIHIGDNKPPKDENYSNKNIVKGNINNTGDVHIGDKYE